MFPILHNNTITITVVVILRLNFTYFTYFATNYCDMFMSQIVVLLLYIAYETLTLFRQLSLPLFRTCFLFCSLFVINVVCK